MCLLLLAAWPLWAERVADIPIETRYVNDYAGVLSPQARATMEAECVALHTQANADVAVVTIKQLEDGQSASDFAVALEEKWKLGKKGSDRDLIYLLVLNPHRLWISTGYGLEGILNDAKVGGIVDTARPYATRGDYDDAMETGLEGVAQVIAADAHVTLAPMTHTYRSVPVNAAQGNSTGGGSGGLIVALVLGAILLVLVLTGNGGMAFALLFNLLGSGGGFGGAGGGGRDDDDRGGGGFSGNGGGESGGGGAGRDF